MGLDCMVVVSMQGPCRALEHRTRTTGGPFHQKQRPMALQHNLSCLQVVAQRMLPLVSDQVSFHGQTLG